MDPSLTPEELIRRVADDFIRLGEWPLLHRLQADYGPRQNVRRVALESKGRMICDEGRDARCRLPLETLAGLPIAHADVDRLAKAVGIIARRFSANGSVAVTHQEIATELGADELSLRKLGHLIINLPLWTGGSYDPAVGVPFSITPGERAAFFVEVHSYEDYAITLARVNADQEFIWRQNTSMQDSPSVVAARWTYHLPEVEATLALLVGDALEIQADVLAVKYADKWYGVAAEAVGRIGLSDDLALPAPGAHLWLDAGGRIGAGHVLVLGTVPLRHFAYAEVRDWSRNAVAMAAQCPSGPPRQLLMTMHGVNAGLDESESFIAQLAGMLDAMRRDEWPRSLREVTIVDRDRKRLERLAEVFHEVLPRKIEEQLSVRDRDRFSSAPIDTAGIGSKDKPRVFVAMEFGEDTVDRFHFGISNVVRAAGYLCERIDEVHFTGDILEQIKRRIDLSEFVIADLTTANPNVYLEVGYAWGRGIPTVLLAQRENQLRFDVRGHRTIMYKNVLDLAQKLERELGALRSYLGRYGPRAGRRFPVDELPKD